MEFNPNKHLRRSIRLKGYDYAQAGLYFITICCQDRANLFGEIINGKMILNEFGKIAHKEWQSTEAVRDNCHIHEFIIMPNHIHGIIEIIFKKREEGEEEIGKFQSPSQTIGSIIRGFKIATIKKIKDLIKEKDNRIEDKRIKDNRIEDNRIEDKGIEDNSTGELQFAPTAPTAAPTPIPIPIPIPTKKIKSLNFKIWQRNYYEIIIKDKKAYHNISQYIINNPKNWGKDKLK